MPEVDPQEFGKLVGTVEHLVLKVDHISNEVDCIRSQMNKGKGIVAGMLVASGGIGAGIAHLLERLLK